MLRSLVGSEMCIRDRMSLVLIVVALQECWVSEAEQSCAPVSGSRPHCLPPISRSSLLHYRDFRPSSLEASSEYMFPAAAEMECRALASTASHCWKMTRRLRNQMVTLSDPPPHRNVLLSAASAACVESVAAAHGCLSHVNSPRAFCEKQLFQTCKNICAEF